MKDINTLTAETQRTIGYIWIVGFFVIMLLRVLGFSKEAPPNDLYTLTAVVLYFFFSRGRNQETPPPGTVVKSEVSSTKIGANDESKA